MHQKECPSCAVEVDSEHSECPVCGYEFPAKGQFRFKAAGWLLLILFIFIVFRFVINMVF